MKQVFFVMLIALASCTNGVATKEISTDSTTTTNIESVEDVKQAAYTEAEKDSMKKVLNTLEKKFIKEEDEFNNVTFYTHKTFGKNWPNRSTLRPVVRNDGSFYLESNYYGEDWLWHSKVIVLANGKTWESPTLSITSNNHKTDNSAYHVWEVNQYLEGDNGLTYFVAHNDNSDIKVRFVGQKSVSDAKLSKADVKAINETLQFAELLKYFK